MKTFLYILEPVRPASTTSPTALEQEVNSRHLEHLRRLHQTGVLVFAGRVRGEGGLGYVVVRADDLETAASIMSSDPQYREGTMRGRVQPIGIASFP